MRKLISIIAASAVSVTVFAQTTTVAPVTPKPAPNLAAGIQPVTTAPSTALTSPTVKPITTTAPIVVIPKFDIKEVIVPGRGPIPQPSRTGP
jgi:hypothetical protein